MQLPGGKAATQLSEGSRKAIWLDGEECGLATCCKNARQGMLHNAGATLHSAGPAGEVVLYDASTSTCEGGEHPSSPHLVVILLQKALHQGRPLLQAFPQPPFQVCAPSLQAGAHILNYSIILLRCLAAVCLTGNPEELITNNESAQHLVHLSVWTQSMQTSAHRRACGERGGAEEGYVLLARARRCGPAQRHHAGQDVARAVCKRAVLRNLQTIDLDARKLLAPRTMSA